MTGAPDDAKAGFEEEALPHLDAVYRFALRLSGTPDGAEDLVQETFLRAFRSWDRFSRGTAAKSWLFTICRNVFLRGVERSNRHDTIVKENAGPPGADLEPASPVWASVIGTDPEGDFFESIVDEQVIEAIDALPEDFRTPVVLSDVEGLTYAEIADLLDVPIGTVKSRLFRGRRQLQRVLYDFALEAGYLSGPGAGATQQEQEEGGS